MVNATPSRGVLVFVTTILIVIGAYASTSELMSPSSAGSSQVTSSATSATYTSGSLLLSGSPAQLDDILRSCLNDH